MSSFDPNPRQMRDLMGQMSATEFLNGRELEGIYKNGTTMVIRTKCGREATFGWCNQDGHQLPGHPVMIRNATHIRATRDVIKRR